MTSLPHFIYGSGQEALSFTAEYGGEHVSNDSIITDEMKSICQKDDSKSLNNPKFVYRKRLNF